MAEDGNIVDKQCRKWQLREQQGAVVVNVLMTKRDIIVCKRHRPRHFFDHLHCKEGYGALNGIFLSLVSIIESVLFTLKWIRPIVVANTYQGNGNYKFSAFDDKMIDYIYVYTMFMVYRCCKIWDRLTVCGYLQEQLSIKTTGTIMVHSFEKFGFNFGHKDFL